MLSSNLLKNIGGYVNGEWICESEKTFEVINPATGEKLADVPVLGRSETLRAIDAAEGALDSPAEIHQRRDWLLKIEQLHLSNKDELARILTTEQGKPLNEAKGEVEYAAGFYRYCADHIDELKPLVLDEPLRGCDWTVYYRPAGVVGLITPWNFPIAMIAKKLAAAIAADCPSVIKPASLTPLTMIAFFQLLDEQTDLPAGKVNLVMGASGPISDALFEHPAVRVISFTGSTEVGKELIRNGAADVKRLTLELGGNAAYIVFEDADLDAAADNLMANKFRGSGQTCVCANRIYAQASIAEALSEKIAARVRELKVGNGLEEGTDIGPLIDRDGFEKVRRHVQDALAGGAERIAGADAAEPPGEWGCFFPPTVLRNVTPDMACCTEETFGPLVPIIEFEDEAQAIRMANTTEYGLASYVFTKDVERASRVVSRLHFGHVGINTGTGPTPEAPFGGMKHSGYGREGGREGLFEFVEAQTVPEAE